MRVEKEDVQLDQHCMSAIGTGDDCGEVDRRREDHGMMCVVFSLITMVMGGSRLSDGTSMVPLTVDDLPRSTWENTDLGRDLLSRIPSVLNLDPFLADQI